MIHFVLHLFAAILVYIHNFPQNSIVLYQRHWRHIMFVSTDIVVYNRRDKNCRKNRNGPIHVRRRGQWRDWEEAHYEADGQECHCRIVDRRTKPAQAPATRQKRLISPPLEADAADGGHVGEDQSGIRQRDNGAKSDIGAKVECRNDQRQD